MVSCILVPPTALSAQRSGAACARTPLRSLRFVGDFVPLTPTKDPLGRRPNCVLAAGFAGGDRSLAQWVPGVQLTS